MQTPAPASEETIQRLRFRRAMARKKRREREAAGEIKELNITAMMDMMSIILVFLLKSFSASSVVMTSSADVRPPISTTRAVPKDTVAVTVTPTSILVADKKVVELEGGKIPPALMQGRLVQPLSSALADQVKKLKWIEQRNPEAKFTGELSVVADRQVPYELLLTVLYTAGQNELKNYRFVVLQADDPESGSR